MKTTMMIYQELNELVRDAKNLDGINRRTAFEETKWYSEAEVEEAIATMVLSIKAPDEVLVSCERYLNERLGL